MMNFIINYFVDIADAYVKVMIGLYLGFVAVLFGYWLKPFVRKRSAAYLTAFIYGMAPSVKENIQISEKHIGLSAV